MAKCGIFSGVHWRFLRFDERGDEGREAHSTLTSLLYYDFALFTASGRVLARSQHKNVRCAQLTGCQWCVRLLAGVPSGTN
jgi:hypothetical protein